ncbi:MAG: hypothetical protein NE330_23350 [Lentisphaeraceae bacterium]|nr:hypothetical protein [Lentisphaeraceae bacterium]
MGLTDRLKKLFSKKKKADSAKEDCPLKTCELAVTVGDRAKQTGLKDLKVDVTGKKSGKVSKQTDADGVVLFGKVKPDSYKTDITIPKDDQKFWDEIDSDEFSLSDGENKVRNIWLNPKINYLTPIVQILSSPWYDPVKKESDVAEIDLTIEQTDENINFETGGKLSFRPDEIKVYKDKSCTKELKGPVAALAYKDLSKGKMKAYAKILIAKADIQFSLDDPAHPHRKKKGVSKGTVQRQSIIEVRPTVEAEYKVIALDKELSKHQPDEEDKITVDLVYIQVSLKHSENSEVYDKGAKIVTDESAIELYEDKELKKKLDLQKEISADKLTSPMKLYVKPLKEGKVDIELKPIASDNQRFRLVEDDKIKKKSLTIFKFNLKVFQQDASSLNGLTCNPDQDESTYHSDLESLVLPDQIVLTDEDKIKKGRLLHLQDDENFGRAKIELPKLPSTWPDNCQDYEIVLNKPESSRSGDFTLWDSEFKGKKVNLPYKVKAKDLLKKEKVVWFEGSAETSKSCELRLNMALDRPEGGLAKKVKNHLDWANFTVVKINEVKFEYVATSGPNPWDENSGKLSINLYGRKIKIKAKLSQKIKDIPVHIMLAEHKDNRKQANWGVDMPSDWAWKDVKADIKYLDKTARTDLLHVSNKTNIDGEVECEVTLSQCGGDKFSPAAYISQDPHLAKYIPAKSSLAKLKPVLSAKEITVWRKVFMQITKDKDFAIPSRAVSIGAYEKVKTTLEEAGSVDFVKATAPANTYAKKWLYEPGAADTDVAVIGTHNQAEYFKLFNADKNKPKCHVVVCEKQWDEAAPDRFTFLVDGFSDSTKRVSKEIKLRLDAKRGFISPYYDGATAYISGSWKKSGGSWTNFTADPVIVEQNRSSVSHVKVVLPANAGIPTSLKPIKVKLKIKQMSGPWLGDASTSPNILAVYDNDDDDFNDTISHEIGHLLKQVYKSSDTGIAAHGEQYNKNGSHCKHDYPAKPCVMYEAGPMAGAIHKYCEKCHPYLNIQNMKSF